MCVCGESVCVRKCVCVCVSYLVIHPEADDLCEEGAGEASADQLLVGSAQRRLIQTLPHHAARKLINLNAQVDGALCVGVDLGGGSSLTSHTFPPGETR